MISLRKVRSPLKWHGGKSYLARRIIALFPDHATYVEPFLGGGSVLLNKAPVGREVAGDIDPRLIEFWTYLARNGWILKSLVDGLDYGEETFRKATACLEDDDNIGRRVLGFVVRNRMSRGGLGKDFAWSERLRGKRRTGGPVPGDVNAWDTIRAELPAIAERVRSVEFHTCDAIQLIRSNDAPNAVIYCDPPYLHKTRTARDAYAYEMTQEQHGRLLDVLLACRGKVFLSGYRNNLYDARLAGWVRHEFDMPNHAGQGRTKQRRIECVWEGP
jgi:DNA adenine methylase